jgi:hypothetical protein
MITGLEEAASTNKELILCDQQSDRAVDCAIHTAAAMAFVLAGKGPGQEKTYEEVDERMVRTRRLLAHHFQMELKEYKEAHRLNDGPKDVAIEWIGLPEGQGLSSAMTSFEQIQKLGHAALLNNDMLSVMMTELWVMGAEGILGTILRGELDGNLRERERETLEFVKDRGGRERDDRRRALEQMYTSRLESREAEEYHAMGSGDTAGSGQQDDGGEGDPEERVGSTATHDRGTATKGKTFESEKRELLIRITAGSQVAHGFEGLPITVRVEASQGDELHATVVSKDDDEPGSETHVKMFITADEILHDPGEFLWNLSELVPACVEELWAGTANKHRIPDEASNQAMDSICS